MNKLLKIFLFQFAIGLGVCALISIMDNWSTAMYLTFVFAWAIPMTLWEYKLSDLFVTWWQDQNNSTSKK